MTGGPRTDGRTAWRVAIASLLLIAVGLGVENMLLTKLRTIADDMGWLRWIPSAAYACEMLGMGLGGILMGRWSDRAGTGVVVLVGTLMLPSAALALSQATQAWQFCVVFGVMVGLLGNAALFVPLTTAATRWFDRRRGLAVAIVASGQGVAGVVWPRLFDRLSSVIGWRHTLVLYGLFALVVMPPLVLAIRARPPGWHDLGEQRAMARRGGARFGGWRENLPQMLLCAAIVCCCVAMAMPLVHIVAHVQDIGYSGSDGAALLGWIMALAFVGRLGMGALADHIGPLRAMLIGSALQATGLAILIPADSLAAIYVAATVFGLGFGGLVPIYAVALRSIYPAHSLGWRIGTTFLFGATGMALGGQAAGAIFDLTGSYAPAFSLGLSFNLINLAILYTVHLMTRGRPRVALA